MDFLSDNSNKPSSHSHHPQPSSSELLSSAKVVGQAAMSTVHHESEKIDKAKVADAAADLLGAASHYGKLEETSFGKYVEKAENYLHQYHHSSQSPTGEVHSSSAAPGATTVHSSAHSTHSPTTTMEHHSSSAHSGEEAQSEGGLGDYMKMAQGFLKKH